MRGFNLGLALLLTVTSLVACNENKSERVAESPRASSRHSDQFNGKVNGMMTAYYALSEAFVQWDSLKVNTQTLQLASNLDSVTLEGVDSTTTDAAKKILDSARLEVKQMSSNIDMTAKRRILNTFSGKLYNFLRSVQFDEKKLYLQECPMAFNDVEPGIWMSETPEIRNPYLGLHHPMYGKGMLHCGETKDSLNFDGRK